MKDLIKAAVKERSRKKGPAVDGIRFHDIRIMRSTGAKTSARGLAIKLYRFQINILRNHFPLNIGKITSE